MKNGDFLVLQKCQKIQEPYLEVFGFIILQQLGLFHLSNQEVIENLVGHAQPFKNKSRFFV